MTYSDAIAGALADELQLPDGFECVYDGHGLVIRHRDMRSTYVYTFVVGDNIQAWGNGRYDRHSMVAPLNDPGCLDLLQQFVTTACDRFSELVRRSVIDGLC